jgi:hypothetical protein
LEVSVDRDEVLKIMQSDIDATRLVMKHAMKVFDSMVREVPSAIPHPDGVQRIKNASRDLSSARAALNAAVARQCAFVLHGIVPDDLFTQAREKIERKPRADSS